MSAQLQGRPADPAPPPVRDVGVQLGGRKFEVVNFDRRTLRIDCYLRRIVDEIGIGKMWFKDGETEIQFGLRLESLIIHSGKIEQLLAGYLLPEKTTEREWTEERAGAVADFLGTLDTAADRQLAIELAREVAYGFFRQWLGWFKRSLSYFETKATMAKRTQSTNPEDASTAESGRR